MAAYYFDFGIGESPSPPYAQVLPDTIYTKERGYGFEPNSRISTRNRGGDRLNGAFCIPLEAVFRVDLPDGLYHVTVTMGDAEAPTVTSITYGLRRHVVHKAETIAGQFTVRSFTVKASEGNLMFTFSGAAPRINALTIEAAPHASTIYLAGDSTMTDQEKFPYAGWGQLLPLFFKQEIAVDNRAKSGRSSRSFIDEGRLAAILEEIRAGDYLWIQFGHNDSKPDPERATEPFGSYKEKLAVYVNEARERGALPVLITPMHRREFDERQRIIDTHGDYITAMKQLADEQEVPLIDLAERSRALFEEAGPEASKQWFMWTYPGEYIHFPDGLQDDTHFNERGALAIAGLVAEGLRELPLPVLQLYLKPPVA